MVRFYVLAFVTLLILGACADRVDTTQTLRAVEPTRHPEIDPPLPDGGIRDAGAAPAMTNTSELSSPYSDCMEPVWQAYYSCTAGNSCCSDDVCYCGCRIDYAACEGLSREPYPVPSDSYPTSSCSGVVECHGRCLCDLCGWLIGCFDPPSDPHGPGSGPACENCHWSGSAYGSLKNFDPLPLVTQDLEYFMCPVVTPGDCD